MDKEIDYKKKYQERNKYINTYMKNNYDRVVLLLPKGTKEQLENRSKKGGFKSVNDYLKNVIDNLLKSED